MSAVISQTQNAVAAIAYADSPATYPPGSVVDHIAVTATGSAPGNTTPVSQSVAPGTASVTFASLTPDTYTITAQAFPASGAGYGTPVSASITITAVSDISLSLPSAITLSQP